MHGAVNALPSHRVRAAAAILILTAVAACTTRLAPAYDQTIVDGLASANRDAQTLFASIGSEATKESFPSRKDSYDHIVGSLNALAIQAKARPSPDVSLTDVNAALAHAGIPAIVNDPKFADVPSARSMSDAAETVQKMEATDASEGLHGNEIEAFENQTNVYLSQAIAYESFLKR
jgi:hypothetical protein